MAWTQTARDTLLAHLQLAGQWLRRAQPAPPNRPADRRLLLMVGEFAPAVAGGVYRPAALARYAARAGWEVTVVTGPAPSSPSAAGLRLLDYVGDRVRILRHARSRLEPSVRWFPHVDGGMLTALAMVDATCAHFGGDVPSNIIATGPPFCAHIAAWMLGRANRASVTLEYRDEWTECPFDFVDKQHANRAWERRCLARADRIVVTTPSQKAHLEQVFGGRAGARCVVVPNGWEPAESVSVEAPTPTPQPPPVVLTFAGKLGGHTDPARFLGLLEQLAERQPQWRDWLRIRVVGSRRADAEEMLSRFRHPDMLELHPLVPQQDAARLMRASHGLLLFHDPRFARYLPGKLYEYIAARVPIVVFDDHGESRRLVEELGIGWALSADDVQGFADLLTALTERRGPDVASSSRLTPWLESHTRERLSRSLLSLMERPPGATPPGPAT